MPPLAFAPAEPTFGPNYCITETLIEVTQRTRIFVIRTAAAYSGTLNRRHLSDLQGLMADEPGNDELAVLIGQIQAHGTVFVRLI